MKVASLSKEAVMVFSSLPVGSTDDFVGDFLHLAGFEPDAAAPGRTAVESRATLS